MKHKNFLFALALIASVVVTSNAKASLYNRGNGMIYDDVSDITFSSDANLFQTQAASNANLVNTIISDTPSVGGYLLSISDFTASSGQMNWWGAQAWIGYLNKSSYNGYNNWSLPATLVKVSGWSFSSSQMGELFRNELGGIVGNWMTPAFRNANYNLFTNIQPVLYWSSAEDPSVIYPLGYGWYFNNIDGTQSSGPKSQQLYAWAVHPGDVSAVPLPGAVWLFSSGLFGLLGFKKRKAD